MPLTRAQTQDPKYLKPATLSIKPSPGWRNKGCGEKRGLWEYTWGIHDGYSGKLSGKKNWKLEFAHLFLLLFSRSFLHEPCSSAKNGLIAELSLVEEVCLHESSFIKCFLVITRLHEICGLQTWLLSDWGSLSLVFLLCSAVTSIPMEELVSHAVQAH